MISQDLFWYKIAELYILFFKKKSIKIISNFSLLSTLSHIFAIWRLLFTTPNIPLAFIQRFPPIYPQIYTKFNYNEN